MNIDVGTEGIIERLSALLRGSGLPASLNINISVTLSGLDQAATDEIAGDELLVPETVAATTKESASERKWLKKQRLVIDGVEKTVFEWCEHYKIDRNNYRTRIYHGWHPVVALQTPLLRTFRKSSLAETAPPPPPAPPPAPPAPPAPAPAPVVSLVPRMIPFGAKRKRGKVAKIVWRNGQGRTTAEWCAFYGVSYGTYMNRIRAGWTQNDAFTTPVREQLNSRR